MDVNPLLLGELRKEAIEAKEKPGQHSEFRIKRLNRPSSVAKGWVNLTKWRQCARVVPFEDLRGVPCWGGLDLASTTDLCSFRLVWMVDDLLVTHGWRFVPRAAVRRRVERGLIPYAGWVQKGYLIESGTEAIDYDVVRATIEHCAERFELQDVGYDSWNATQTAQKLGEAGVSMEQFIQGPKSYHPAMQALEVAYLGGQFAHGGDPVLNWCASNLVAREDVNLNRAPDKKRSTEKIDDMSALLMGIGRALQGEGMANLLEALKSPVTA
jgi:phage terminase large subunit-like protein